VSTHFSIRFYQILEERKNEDKRFIKDPGRGRPKLLDAIVSISWSPKAGTFGKTESPKAGQPLRDRIGSISKAMLSGFFGCRDASGTG
jgi:hypothetical protein